MICRGRISSICIFIFTAHKCIRHYGEYPYTVEGSHRVVGPIKRDTQIVYQSVEQKSEAGEWMGLVLCGLVLCPVSYDYW